MASPVRFPSGISTFPPKSLLASYPVAPNQNQMAILENFLPYRAGDYTVTTAVAGTAATFGQNGGALKLATSASGTDTIYLLRGGAGFQLTKGRRMWGNFRLAYPRSVVNANDTNIYAGFFNAAVLSAATDGIYFLKPSGGTSVNLIIKKASTVTTFQNVADLAVPSGIYGDTNSTNGTLTAVVAGNAFTGISVASAGGGYAYAPLVLSTTASGVAGNVPVHVGLGSASMSATQPQVPMPSSGLPYGSLYDPVVVAPGSGYTNSAGSAAYLEAEPWIDLQLFFDGDTLYAGVNGRAVLSIGPDGRTSFAAGATVAVQTTGPSYAPTTQLTSAISPVQPKVGSAYNIMPLVALNAAFGMSNTTANIRNLYVGEVNAAVELF